MTKSSVDRKRSKYGEKYSLRFHKRLKTYDLSCNDETPHLIAKFVETDGDLAMRLFERLESNYKENEQLKEENQQYKVLLQDMGFLISDEDVMCIRTEIADKFIKPICKETGFDVDVDCTNGFTIIPKGDD